MKTDRIREHSIYEIISKIYPANYRQKRPGDYWAISPFTNERTASFHVVEAKGFFKCFSTGESGDAISFVEKYLGLEFRQAMEHIYNLLNWEIDSETSYDNRPQTRKWFTNFAHDNLIKNNSNFSRLTHLMSSRQIRTSTIVSAKIGYIDYATPIPPEMIQDLSSAGLVRHREDGTSYWTFGDRYIFPYLTISGGTTGYSARASETSRSKAKYKNSSEEDGFNKSRELYGLNDARYESTKTGRIIVVEGQMDRIGLADSGVLDVVAPGGTALTTEQAKIIAGMEKEVLLWYDYDRAGVGAMIKAMGTFLSVGAIPQIVKERGLDGDPDPDDIRKQIDDVNDYIRTHKKGFGEYMAEVFSVANASAKPKVVQILINTVNYSLEEWIANSVVEEFCEHANVKTSEIIKHVSVSIKPAKNTRKQEITDDAYRVIHHLVCNPDDVVVVAESLGPNYKFEDPALQFLWRYIKDRKPIPLTVMNSDAADTYIEMSDPENEARLHESALKLFSGLMKSAWVQRERVEIQKRLGDGTMGSEEALERLSELGLQLQ